jgi:hypothetical protein
VGCRRFSQANDGSSIPVGLEIYVAPIEIDSTAAKADGRWVANGAKHPVVSKSYRRGNTPILLENVIAGDYLVALVQPVNLAQEFHIEGVKTVAWVNAGEIDEKWMQRYASNQLTEAFPVVYSVSQEVVSQGATIFSTVNWDGADQRIQAAYPKERNFEFDEERLRTEFSAEAVAQGVTVQETDTTMERLRRGGIAVLRNPSLQSRVWVQLLPGGRWRTSSQINAAWLRK